LIGESWPGDQLYLRLSFHLGKDAAAENNLEEGLFEATFARTCVKTQPNAQKQAGERRGEIYSGNVQTYFFVEASRVRGLAASASQIIGVERR